MCSYIVIKIIVSASRGNPRPAAGGTRAGDPGPLITKIQNKNPSKQSLVKEKRIGDKFDKTRAPPTRHDQTAIIELTLI